MEYVLKRSKRKSLSLQITPELTVLVRAPMRVSKREIERFVHTNISWVSKHLEMQRLHNETYPTPTQAEIDMLMIQAKAVIPQRVMHYSKVMELTPAAVKFTAAKTRFGSCSAKNNLNFSCLLMQYPIDSIDYVVVHELVHIVHKNHGKDFYALIESILPDWRKRREQLKR